MRGAVLHVHDAVVAAMNAGRDVYAVMREISLPPELEVGEGYGKVHVVGARDLGDLPGLVPRALDHRALSGAVLERVARAGGARRRTRTPVAEAAQQQGRDRAGRGAAPGRGRARRGPEACAARSRRASRAHRALLRARAATSGRRAGSRRRSASSSARSRALREPAARRDPHRRPREPVLTRRPAGGARVRRSRTRSSFSEAAVLDGRAPADRPLRLRRRRLPRAPARVWLSADRGGRAASTRSAASACSSNLRALPREPAALRGPAAAPPRDPRDRDRAADHRGRAAALGHHAPREPDRRRHAAALAAVLGEPRAGAGARRGRRAATGAIRAGCAASAPTSSRSRRCR